MILKSKLLFVCLLASSCTNVDKAHFALFESQTSRETPSGSLGSPREFHGETIVFQNGGEVVSQTATTYFLEHPRRSRGMPQVAAPYRGDSNRLSVDEMKQLYGEPDYIDESGRWHYWGSDGGELLRVRR